jgi:hypothetical protein
VISVVGDPELVTLTSCPPVPAMVTEVATFRVGCANPTVAMRSAVAARIAEFLRSL